MAHDKQATIQRLRQRYDFLAGQDDVGFIRELSGFLKTIDEERAAAEIVAQFRREADEAEAEFNRVHDELVREVVDIRNRLVADAPEIDDSAVPRPDQMSQEYAFWKIDSIGGFDETAAQSERIAFAPMPFYDTGDRSRVQRLVQILRGRIYAAEYGTQFGRGGVPAERIRNDLGGYRDELENVQAKYEAIKRQFKHAEATLPGLADERLRVFAASLTPEPFLRDANEDPEAFMERALLHVYDSLGVRGVLRQAVDGRQLTAGEKEVFDRIVSFLRAEAKRLHVELLDRLTVEKRPTLLDRAWRNVGRGTKWLVGTAAVAVVSSIVGLLITLAMAHYGGDDSEPSPGTSEAVEVSGRVVCQSGAEVVGVFVRGDSGDGGHARWEPESVPNRARYAFELDDSDEFRVGVGCGGTRGAWPVDVRSPLVPVGNRDFTCDDQPAPPRRPRCLLDVNR